MAAELRENSIKEAAIKSKFSDNRDKQKKNRCGTISCARWGCTYSWAMQQQAAAVEASRKKKKERGFVLYKGLLGLIKTAYTECFFFSLA